MPNNKFVRLKFRQNEGGSSADMDEVNVSR